MKSEKISNYLLYGLAGLFAFNILRNATRIKDTIFPADINAELAFLRKMKPIAEEIQRARGIKTIITISQSALESNWGTSRLAREGNNLFGMNATQGWIDSGRATITGEKGRAFKKYYDWQESADDWARLISTATRYVKLYSYAKSGNISSFGTEVHRSGYAEDSNYQNALVARAREVSKYV